MDDRNLTRYYAFDMHSQVTDLQVKFYEQTKRGIGRGAKLHMSATFSIDI